MVHCLLSIEMPHRLRVIDHGFKHRKRRVLTRTAPNGSLHSCVADHDISRDTGSQAQIGTGTHCANDGFRGGSAVKDECAHGDGDRGNFLTVVAMLMMMTL